MDDEEIELSRHFQNIHLESSDENWTPSEDYYMHIDIIHGASSLCKKKLILT